MKKISILIAGLIMVSFIACGPSQEEQDKQKKTDDSLFEKDRNTALDKANELLSDTVAAVKDTTVKKKN